LIQAGGIYLLDSIAIVFLVFAYDLVMDCVSEF